MVGLGQRVARQDPSDQGKSSSLRGTCGWLCMGSKDEDPALKAAGVVTDQVAGGGGLVSEVRAPWQPTVELALLLQMFMPRDFWAITSDLRPSVPSISSLDSAQPRPDPQLTLIAACCMLQATV